MSDPARIRSIAVHREDVATALEATLRTDRRVVLRITPPFSGRMRARIHDAGDGSADEVGGRIDDDADGGTRSDGESPIHVDPQELVGDVPSYPEADETAAAYPESDVETRRERHGEAVAAWREAVRNGIVDVVRIDADGDEREVDVVALG